MHAADGWVAIGRRIQRRYSRVARSRHSSCPSGKMESRQCRPSSARRTPHSARASDGAWRDRQHGTRPRRRGCRDDAEASRKRANGRPSFPPSGDISPLRARRGEAGARQSPTHRDASAADETGASDRRHLADDINRSVIQDQSDGWQVRMAAMDLLAPRPSVPRPRSSGMTRATRAPVLRRGYFHQDEGAGGMSRMRSDPETAPC